VAMPVFRISVIGVVQIDLVCRIDDSVFLLQTMAATERDVASADHGVSADIVVLVDCNDGCTLITCGNGRAKARRSSPGDDDIRLAIPSRRDLGIGFLRAEPGHGGCAQTHGGALVYKPSSSNAGLLLVCIHRLVLISTSKCI